MAAYSCQLVEYDALRPWIVLSTQHRTVDLPDGADFDRRARARFPDDWFRALRADDSERWSTLRPDATSQTRRP
jgi:hypothetical protein